MTAVQERIKEVHQFFDSNDTVLGYRKLLDRAMDTQDFDIYKELIELTDWKEKHPENQEELVQRAKRALEKIEKIQIQENNATNAIVEANDLVKSYGRNRFQLGPVSLQIKKGQVYGLVGENGNGKTTLLRLLAKDLAHTSGSLQYEFDTAIPTDYDLRTRLIYIPQRTVRWYGSLKDNLKFVLSNYKVPSEENELRVLMMIARFGLWNYKHLKWRELSSGYKMRFELARTMLRQPELLLLDEPLANLDILSQQVILEDLKSICNSVNNPIGLILSSQQLYEVEKVSDKVVFLKNGQHTSTEGKDNEADRSGEPLIVEIECNAERTSLENALNSLGVQRLTFNGGVYIAYFGSETPYHKVLSALGAAQIEVIYTRNISRSSRRFFVS